jgi:hypothetical protein
MKKFLLSTLAATSLLFANAATPTFNWAYAIDTNYANDQIGGIVKTSDNKFVTYSHMASQAEDDKITYNGETIGTLGKTASENYNLAIIKHNTDGKKDWAVYSKQGYFSAGNGAVYATPDGGVILYAKPRGSKSTATQIDQPKLVDASGAVIDFPDFPTLNWTYNSVLVKISGEGHVEWIREFATDELPLVSDSKQAALTDAITPLAVAIDADGYIYVAGNFRAATMFTGDKNSKYFIQPRNVTTSTTSGGSYLIKLTDKGDWAGQVRVSGTATRDQITSLAYEGGNIYFCGNVQGAADDVITVGDKTITLENDLDGILYGSVATNLTVNYVGYVKAFGYTTDGKHTTQIKGFRKIDSDLYILGLVKGGFGPAKASDAVATTESASLNPFIVKLSATDGSWGGALVHADKANDAVVTGGYFDIFKNNDKLYAYGYGMNAAVGVFVDELGSDLSFVQKQSLILGGGMPTTAAAAVFDSTTGNLITSARGNAKFTFTGSESTYIPLNSKYGAVLASFNLGTTGGVSDATANAVSLSADKNSVIVKASEPTEVRIYNTLGVQVAAQTVAAGTTHIALPQGIYIVNNTKLIVG